MIHLLKKFSKLLLLHKKCVNKYISNFNNNEMNASFVGIRVSSDKLN